MSSWKLWMVLITARVFLTYPKHKAHTCSVNDPVWVVIRSKGTLTSGPLALHSHPVYLVRERKNSAAEEGRETRHCVTNIRVKKKPNS